MKSFVKVVIWVVGIFFLGFLAAVSNQYEIDQQTNKCISSGGKVVKSMSNRNRNVIMCEYNG